MPSVAAVAAVAAAAARHPKLTIVVVLLITLWGVGVAAGDDEEKAQESATAQAQDGRSSGGTTKQGRGPRAKPSTTPKPTPRPTQKPTPRSTFLVTRVIDGDTLELGNGQTVRLVGIDTPEVGECGYQAASDALSGLVLGKRVRLTISDEDKDQYGRLLRYVDFATTDAGLRLIKRGLAVARYDSRDGYGYHPRQPRYIDADAASKDVTCAKPAPLVGGGGGAGGGKCAPGYDPCIPPYPPDLDCGDLDGPIAVTGDDPHGLDADGDGWACES